ncbi:glutathione S-transferase [Tepidamorphus sp. 3E244]|uniref:glutathione S-transferase n=1 Tax=Tepidamorphus sp. 3E244 TaxID=3385498 RepID=UPI0038FC2136
MKLLHAPTSPFVRKVMVVAHEAGLAGSIETEFVLASPVERGEDLAAHNPLGKIPALILDDGSTLYDSRVICEYLAALKPETGLFPDGEARWETLTQQAMADGLLDAAIATRYERVMRPQAAQWSGWADAQLAKVTGALDRIEAIVGDLPERPTIGTITIGCALGYLDFRFPELRWRDGRPAAANWFSAFETRPSMVATRPAEHVA